MSDSVSPSTKRPTSQRSRDDSCTDCLTEEETPGKRRRGVDDSGLASGKASKEGGEEDDTPRTSTAADTVATPAAVKGFGELFASSQNSNLFKKWQVGERYELVKSIGHGSYGQVAEAIDRRGGGRKVAIKRIENIFDQQVDTKRILREVYILRHLKHENVIQLLDIVKPQGQEDFNEIYLVFEFVDTDLNKLINSPQYLTIEHVKTFLYQLLCALKYIHSSLVIHRDIKPANILLSEDCGLKICDFGLARVVPSSRFVGDGAVAIAAEAERTAKEKREKRKRKRDFSNHQPIRKRSASTDSEGCHAHSTPRVGETSMDDEDDIDDEGEDQEMSQSKSRENPKRLTRQLTKHVVTRWYRPPELILLQDYTNAVDMWSVGCIFAELLGMQKDSIKSFKERSPLFPGKSCFPLSADNERTYKDRLDQLNVIFNIIGTPQEQDIETLGEVKNYLRGLPVKVRRDFQKMYKAAPPEAIDLLNQMLVFDPRNRISVEKALDHPFLQSVRVPACEVVAPEGLLSELDRVELSSAELRQGLMNEIMYYEKKRNTPTSA